MPAIEVDISKIQHLHPARIVVAVSGGSDSTALLHLLFDIARQEQIELFAATVDHGLRAESASEVDTAARQKLTDEYSRVKAQWADRVMEMNQQIQGLNIEQPLAHLEVLKLRLDDELTRVDSLKDVKRENKIS